MLFLHNNRCWRKTACRVWLMTATLSAVAFAQQPSFGDKADVVYAKDLWQALVAGKLAGPGALQTRPYYSQPPHGAITQTIYADVDIAGERADIIVKRNYGGTDVGSQAVAQNPDKFLQTISVMVKRPGYAPQSSDWFWVSFLPGGDVARNPQNKALTGAISDGNALTGCIDCHRSAAGNDMVFSR